MMRIRQRIRQAACALFACMGLTASAATIDYAAEGTTAEYCAKGFGIDVSVSTPATGSTVKYAENAEGPWLDEVKYVDVCTDKPIHFQITAAGYETVTGFKTVTVTPKALTDEYVWPVFPSEDLYVYDGTAKTPESGFGDGDPSILTRDDFEVVYADNVNAGTAKMIFTGKNNYTGTVECEFEILKAENVWTTEPAVADWTYGQAASEPVSAAKSGTATVTWSSGAKPTTPGNYKATFTVPESDNYKELTKDVEFTIHAATIEYVADDGIPGEYCGAGFGITVTVSKPAIGATVTYSESAEGPWLDEVKYVDVCTDKPIHFQITAAGYETVTGFKTVTVTPKALTDEYVWPVFPSEDLYVYDGTAKTPESGFGDGDPSILTRDDFEVVYADNVNAGTAKMIFTGKNNYTGTVECEFEIKKRSVTLTSGDGSWTHDGAAHSATTVTVGGDGFVSGEGATYGNFASLTNAESVPNTFDYTLNDGTMADNYEIAKVYGTLTVTAPAVAVYEETDAETIFKWEATDEKTAKVVGFKDPNQRIANVVVPDKIEGHFITAIGAGAFANSTCGMTSLTLPLFCTEIGRRAFSGIATLTGVTFASVLNWRNPSEAASLAIGAYAFTSTGLADVRLPVEVSEIGDYAFADCRKLAKVMILGKPVVGTRPFRRAGIDVSAATGPTVRLSKTLAEDEAYLAKVTQGVQDAVVRTDAIVESVTVGTLSVAPNAVRLSVAVGRAADWGEVDASRVKVEYRERLGDAATTLVPRAVTQEADGSLTVEVAAPEGPSGFFRVKVED